MKMQKFIVAALLMGCFIPSSNQQSIPGGGFDMVLKFLGLDDIFKNISTADNATDILKERMEKIDLQKLVTNPILQQILKGSDLNPKFLEVIFEGVTMKKLLPSLNISALLKAKQSGNITNPIGLVNIQKLLSTFDFQNIFENPLIIQEVAKRTKISNITLLTVINSIDVNKAMKSIDLNTFIAAYMNGTGANNPTTTLLQSTNMKILLDSIDFKKLLQDPTVLALVGKATGMPSELLKTAFGVINVGEVLKQVNMEKLIGDLISGNNTEVMKVILGSINASDFIKDLDLIGIAKIFLSNSMPAVSSSCRIEYTNLVAPLQKNASLDKITQSDLVKYIDSWGKLPARTVFGNTQWFGAYDECKSIPNAKYCLSGMLLAGRLPGAYGSCMPKGCTYEDNLMILNAMGKVIQTSFGPYPGVRCEEPREYRTGFILTLLLCSLILLLCFIGTVLDFLGASEWAYTIKSDKRSKENLGLSNLGHEIDGTTLPNDATPITDEINGKGKFIAKFFTCFSILKNSRAVLSTKSPKGAIESINGIRTISMWWVILGHSYFFMTMRLPDNVSKAMDVIQRFSFMSVANAYVSVDTFFLLSGVLVGYLALKRMDKNNGKLNIPMFYLHRFIRLTPPYMFCILLWNNIFPMTLNGPNSEILRTDANYELCDKYWWTNLFYISNLYPWKMEQECMGWSWYLSNDMQFYVFSPVVLYIMYYFGKKYESSSLRHVGAYLITFFLCLLCSIITAAIIGARDYPVLISAAFLPNYPKKELMLEAEAEIYIKPWTRIAPYLIGLLLGYLLSRKAEIPSSYKKSFVIIGWISSILIGYAVVYGPYSAFKEGGEPFNLAERVMYGSLHRVAFAVAVAWVIYACHNKCGSLINEFLSWRLWIPLSRLTFGSYLLHPLVFTYFFISHENSTHYQDNLWVYYVVANTFVSYVAAYILAVCVEYPVLNLEKMIFKR